MSQTEQTEFDQLREQLKGVQSSADEVRARLTGLLDHSQEELRLYRGLFWGMLAFAIGAALFQLLNR